jgi:Flp pilus assembly protein TadG
LTEEIVVRIRRRGVNRERGQALVLATLFMTVLLGFAALVIDVGRMSSERRHLQNSADAAALAGAFQLPDDSIMARSDALTWAQKNNLTSDEVSERFVYSIDEPNDTIRVTVQRTVNYTFGRVLNLTNQTLTATATARLWVANGFDVDNPRLFPYAVWGGNQPRNIDIGTRITFRANSYGGANVQAIPGHSSCNPYNNCNWSVTGNNWKGFYHWHSGFTTIYISSSPYDVDSQGGNSIGNEPVGDLLQYQQSGTPIILPVISRASGNGQTINFTIIAFVCVQLDQYELNPSIPWTGVITECVAGGHHDGGTPPAPGIPNAWTPSLIQ